jgi:hypothetical protein
MVMNTIQSVLWSNKPCLSLFLQVMMPRVCAMFLGVMPVYLQAKTTYAPPKNPQQAILQAFLYCDANWLTALTQYADRLPEIKPVVIDGAGGISYIPVPNRRQFDVDGQTRIFNPPFKVQDIAFNEFVDEILPFSIAVTSNDSAQDSHINQANLFEYYWGFNTPVKMSKVIPLIQFLLPPQQRLVKSKNGDIWARIEEFKNDQWQIVSHNHVGRDVIAKNPERALIVQEHEGGGTRVLCGLQAAPLPAAELKRLRPDLSVP